MRRDPRVRLAHVHPPGPGGPPSDVPVVPAAPSAGVSRKVREDLRRGAPRCVTLDDPAGARAPSKSPAVPPADAHDPTASAHPVDDRPARLQGVAGPASVASGTAPSVDPMVSSAIVDARSITAHHPLGTSTGHVVELRGQWDLLVRRALDVSTLAVELAALSEPEFLSLCDWLGDAGRGLPFRFLSVHAPTKQLALPEPDLVELLLALPPVVDAIVVHPDVLREPERFAALGRTLVVENMDGRKGTGRTAAELGPYFDALPDAGFCLDVPHAGSIDPSMGVAHDLLDAFGERLRHVHVSSVDEDCHHLPLTAADEEAFGPVLARCRDVPWILEADLPRR